MADAARAGARLDRALLLDLERRADEHMAEIQRVSRATVRERFGRRRT